MTQELITQLSRLVADHYVFPQVGAQIGAALAKRDADGAYDGLDDAHLAQAVTHDLRSVNADKHLRLVHHLEPLSEQAEDEEVQMQQMRDRGRPAAGRERGSAEDQAVDLPCARGR